MSNQREFEIQVESGSFFGTEAYRRQKGWSDLKHKEERITVLSDTNQSAVQINTSFDWTLNLINGSQAGIYYFLDSMNWIKFVKEKLSKGVFLVLAFQVIFFLKQIFLKSYYHRSMVYPWCLARYLYQMAIIGM